LAALHAVALLDTPTEEAFDRLSRLAARFVNAPVALVSLVDADRQFFKSCIGLPEPWSSIRETPLSHSFCQHNRVAGHPLLIEDARTHPLVKDNLAIRDLNVIAYLGIPLITSDGYVLGSFCVIDYKPRQWGAEDVAVIQDLAAAVMTEIQLRTEIAARNRAEEERDDLAGLNALLRTEIAARKQAEEQQHQLELQLHQGQKMEAIGRLAGGVAHDFNNMLTVILGYAELMKKYVPGDSPLTKNLLGIEKAALRSRDMTRQLLALSRQQIVAPRLLNLNEQLVTTNQTLARLIGEDIDISFRPTVGLWNVRIDPSQLDQIIINLAVNARDALPGGGKLTIETANRSFDEAYCRAHPGFSPGDYVLLSVSDNGTGMDQETMANIFEPFFTTKEIGKGTGLGLATVYGIVKQNEGFINVDSEPWEGTTFRIYFPRSVGHDEISGKIPEAALASGSGTILLVEDDDMVRELTTSMLETIGYRVVVAETPFAALAFCERRDEKIDLLLTDVVMAGMKGTELQNRVAVIRPGIRVLFMSGYTSNVIVHHGILDKGVNYIQKPFSMNDLSQKIRSVMAGDGLGGQCDSHR